MTALSRVPPALAACIAALLCLARPAPAQIVIEGRVLDDMTEEVLAGARVLLLNRFNRTADYAVTDAQGRFRFERSRNERYRLEVRAVGYRETITPDLWTQERDFTAIEVRLLPNAVLLAPLEIVALSPPRTSPILEAVEFRRTRGFGIQITREAIEQRQPLRVTDMLMEIPGVYADRQGSGASGRRLRMGRALLGPGGGDCPVQIFVDGMLATKPVPGGDISVDDIVLPQDVEAIEVFKGLGSVPPEFLNIYSRCGVIAIWTRRSLEGIP
jgi:hypothetical protein